MSTTDWVLIAIQGLVVIGFIALGVRSGGIGLGLWGGVGTLVLVFLFGLDPGEPPISAILIIIAVISAAAAMQAAGGVDYMVQIASKALRARPKLLNFVAPYVSYVLTILTGTGNTFFSIIPVINEVAYSNKIRPERPLAASTVASAAGITSSPVAAAMATMLPLVEVFNYDLIDVHADHGSGEHRRHLRDVARDDRLRERAGQRPGVPAPPGCRRDKASRTAGRDRAAAVRQAQRRDLPHRRPRDLRVRLRRGHPADRRRRGRWRRADVRHAADPDDHAECCGADPGVRTREGQRYPRHADLQVGHGRDDRPVRHRLDGGHVHREQRGRDRRGSRQPGQELAVHDRGRHLPRRRADDEPIGGDPDNGSARPRARDRGRLHDRDVDGRDGCALPPGERNADRRRRVRRNGNHNAWQAGHRPLLPAAAADLLGRDGARRHLDRLALLRRPDAGAARAYDDDARR